MHTVCHLLFLIISLAVEHNIHENLKFLSLSLGVFNINLSHSSTVGTMPFMMWCIKYRWIKASPSDARLKNFMGMGCSLVASSTKQIHYHNIFTNADGINLPHFSSFSLVTIFIGSTVGFML